MISLLHVTLLLTHHPGNEKAVGSRAGGFFYCGKARKIIYELSVTSLARFKKVAFLSCPWQGSVL
jgi:hypothetical protein